MIQALLLTTGILANTALIMYGVKVHQDKESDLVKKKLEITANQMEDLQAVQKVLDNNILLMNATLGEQEYELNMLKNNKKEHAILDQKSLKQDSLKALMKEEE